MRWMHFALERHETATFQPDFPKQAIKLRRRSNYVFYGFILQALPLLYVISIFIAIIFEDVPFLSGMPFIITYMSIPWMVIILIHHILFVIFYLKFIKEDRDAIAAFKQEHNNGR